MTVIPFDTRVCNSDWLTAGEYRIRASRERRQSHPTHADQGYARENPGWFIFQSIFQLQNVVGNDFMIGCNVESRDLASYIPGLLSGDFEYIACIPHENLGSMPR